MKTTDEIYSSMLDTFQQETGYDMEASADLAVRLKAAAAEIYSLYAYGDWVSRMAFPQTASGTYLDYHAQMRGLTRRASSKAQGNIKFYISTALAYDLTIPVGTRCRTAGQVGFVTTQAGTISAGSLWTEVAAEAEACGDAGNVRSGMIVYMTVAPVGVQGCTNTSAFSGGTAGEEDEALRQRVLDSYVRLPNGANAAYYENLVLEDSGVCMVKIIPRYQGNGTVGVIVTPASGVTGTALVQRLQTKLNSLREIAVTVTVRQPAQVPVNISAKLSPAEGYTYLQASTALRQALTAYFDGTLIGKSLRLRDIYEVLNSVAALDNYKLTAPTADTAIAAYELPTLGTVTLEEM